NDGSRRAACRRSLAPVVRHVASARPAIRRRLTRTRNDSTRANPFGSAGMNVRTLASAGLTDVWRSGPVIAIGAGVLALGLLFHVEIAAAVATWDTSTAYNHCFLVLPIVAYLLWDRREVLRDAVADPLPLAALAGIPLAFAWLVAERLGIMEGRPLIAMS